MLNSTINLISACCLSQESRFLNQDVLSAMVASTITDPETCESFFASKSFDVYDLVFGKFLS